MTIEELTPRQREILKLIGEGLSTREIASRLHRTVKTVESHRLALGKKLGARNRVQLAMQAIRFGLTERPESNGVADDVASLRQEIAGDGRAEQAIRSIDAATATTKGREYFRALVSQFTLLCHARCTFIARRCNDQVFRSVAAWSSNGPATPISFPVSHLVAGYLGDGEVRRLSIDSDHPFAQYVSPEGVGTLEGLLLPLFDCHDELLGVMAVFCENDLDCWPCMESVFRICGGRVAAELDRFSQAERLRDSEHRYRLLSENSHDLIAQADAAGTLEFVSPSYTDVLGYQTEELSCATFEDLTVDSDRDALRDIWRSIVQGASHKTIVHRLRCSDGGQRWFETRLTAKRHANGTIRHVVCASSDVHRRMTFERKVRASEERFRDIARAASDWFWEIDENEVYTYCSDRVAGILGYSSEELLGKCMFDFMPPDEAQRIKPMIDELKRDRTSIRNVENWMQTKDGQLICFSTSAIPIIDEHNKFRGFRGVDRDITKDRLIQQQLLDSETTLNRAQYVASVGSWKLDVQTDTLSWSDETYRIFDIPSGTPVTNDTFYAHVHPEDHDKVLATWQQAQQGQVHVIEFRLLISGRVRWVQSRTEFSFDEAGNATTALGTLQDITEKKKLEHRLTRRNFVIANVERMTGLGVWEWNITSDKINVSDEIYRMLDRNRGSLPKTADQLIEQIVHKDSQRQFRDLLDTSAGSGNSFECTLKMLQGDGSPIRLRVRGEAVRDSEGRITHVVGISRPISNDVSCTNTFDTGLANTA